MGLTGDSRGVARGLQGDTMSHLLTHHIDPGKGNPSANRYNKYKEENGNNSGIDLETNLNLPWHAQGILQEGKEKKKLGINR